MSALCDRRSAAPAAHRRHADWCALPLGPGGRSLIEASAGTGKTWTISVLYLRLLLEGGHSPAQIVVTTFTDAAAQELRDRLRVRLRWAARQASAGARLQHGEDPGADE
jgi:exodeoxyribonuclease V beta subunit